MNKKAIALFMLFSFSAQADVLLPIVKNYELAENPLLWQKIKTDKLPEALITEATVKDPNNSYSQLFPKSFLQNDNFIVCYNDCSKDSFSGVKDGLLKFNRFQEWNVVEQSTIYYWLKNYFNFLEERFYFKSQHFLKAYSSREVKDETNSKLKNNAFFLSTDKSLSFLPANKSILFKLLGGKINRSGFDPSVVIHEAGHFYFDQLFGHAVNAEIGGLNEGFADYLAHIVLNNSKVGLVMLQGKALRDASTIISTNGQIKSYAPEKEVHDLGEGISFVLWETRKKVTNKEEFDRLVVGAVKDIARNPYSSVHNFKEAMIERTKTILNGQSLKEVLQLWETLFPGKANVTENMNFLNSNQSQQRIAFDISQTSNEKMAQTFGIDQVTKLNLEVAASAEISDKQSAILLMHQGQELWVAIDNERKNILGIYDTEGKLVTNKKLLKELQLLATNVIDFSSFIKDFGQKLKLFSGLLEGKGDLANAYKVSKTTTQNTTRSINGESVTSKTIKMSLKKRIISRLLGLPDIAEIELYTVPSHLNIKLPEVNGETIIGFNLKYKSGASQEMVLTKLD
ncbi:MAG TPA: hypothetical protein VKY27_00030 [Bacteriovoracaceae bacterium]|nr:hypothetical protein [Bacteriovoracaceae bacterium]